MPPSWGRWSWYVRVLRECAAAAILILDAVFFSLSFFFIASLISPSPITDYKRIRTPEKRWWFGSNKKYYRRGEVLSLCVLVITHGREIIKPTRVIARQRRKVYYFYVQVIYMAASSRATDRGGCWCCIGCLLLNQGKKTRASLWLV